MNEDIRFIKEHQWRVLYYTILFFAAMVGVFQLEVPLRFLHYWAKLLAAAVVFWVMLFSAYHLRATSRNLELYRISGANIDYLLNNLTGIRDALNHLNGRGYREYLDRTRIKSSKWLIGTLTDREQQGRLYAKLFDWLFIFIIVVSGLATIVIIATDSYWF